MNSAGGKKRYWQSRELIIIGTFDVERKHLKYFVEIDRVLQGFRQSLRLGNMLDEETLKKLVELGEVNHEQ